MFPAKSSTRSEGRRDRVGPCTTRFATGFDPGRGIRSVEADRQAAVVQPFASGGRSGFTAEVWGAVASKCSGKDATPAFPARSRQTPATSTSGLSGPSYAVGGSQESRPETASSPEKETVTGSPYQSLASGARFGAARVSGPVPSYLERERPSPRIARLVDARPGHRGRVSPAPVGHRAQASSPDVPSEPVTAKAIARLYQSSRSGGLTATAFVTCGSVASYSKPKDAATLWLPARSRQDPVASPFVVSGPA